MKKGKKPGSPDRKNKSFSPKKGKYKSRRLPEGKNKRGKIKDSAYSGEKSKTPQKEDSQIRLNKYIARTGLCSRREADEYISSGLISVNGKIVTQLGVKVSENDAIKYDGQTLKKERPVYILLNKPKDYITTTDDPYAKKQVIALVKNACDERIYPVGRLDRMTTGVLLLTNDGDLAGKLTHPKFEKKKIYHVFLNKNLQKGDLLKIKEGLQLEDGLTKVDSIAYVTEDDKKQVGIEIHSGKNRVIRRIFEHLNYRVVRLDRVYFAGLTKKGLTKGKWRFLSEKEIVMLKMSAYK